MKPGRGKVVRCGERLKFPQKNELRTFLEITGKVLKEI